MGVPSQHLGPKITTEDIVLGHKFLRRGACCYDLRLNVTGCYPGQGRRASPEQVGEASPRVGKQ